MYLKQNWDNKELMQKCIDMQAEVKNIEHTMLNLELQPEKEEYPILIELHKPKKIWYERKWFILNENLNEWHDFENFNWKVLTY